MEYEGWGRRFQVEDRAKTKTEPLGQMRSVPKSGIRRMSGNEAGRGAESKDLRARLSVCYLQGLGRTLKS